MDAERLRYFELLQRTLDALPALAAPPGDGRGIVTCGGTSFAPSLWLLIRSLRTRGCTLPIELWHLRGEMDDELGRLFAREGVALRDATDAFGAPAPHPRAMHALKPHAIAYSAFREVLFLDADNCAFRDPTFLFDTAEFRDRRAMFWPDWEAMAAALGAAELRRDYGVTDGSGVEFETGQIVIDKIDRWRALALTLHLNEHAEYYYRFLYGDKETFRLALDVLGEAYCLLPVRPALRAGLIHFWTDGGALFHHRCGNAKHKLLRARNLPALPATELRESLDALLRYWRPSTSACLAVYARALQHFVAQATRPAAIRDALRRRWRAGDYAERP